MSTTTPLKPWESAKLNNNNSIGSVNIIPIPQIGTTNTRPALPPRPLQNSYGVSSYNSYPSYGGGYGSYGSYSSLPYRSSLYSSPYSGVGSYGYGGYGSYGGLGTFGSGFGARDNTEERFIQYAEERSRNAFSSVENIVRAFSSISMMLDNTFFAMTSSFRAVLSVADNFGRLRTVFAQIWYSVNIFRFFTWLYRKLQELLGLKVSTNAKSLAWNEAVSETMPILSEESKKGSSWSVLAFLSAIVAAPYIISKLLPKYEDKCDPQKWIQSGVHAKAVFDFVATSQNEMTINTNDNIILAPKHIQEEMRLYNTGWALGTCNGRSGVIPLNYIVVVKNIKRNNNSNNNIISDVPIPRPSTSTIPKQKRVSFGENQIIELKNLAEENQTNESKNLEPSTTLNKDVSDIKEDIPGHMT